MCAVILPLSFKVTSGDLPPGCSLEVAQTGARALVRGKPKAEGAFYFTVSVAIEYDRGGIDTGSTTCLMPVLPARNTNNNSTEDPSSVSSSGGGGGGCDSFPAISALILTALKALRKSKH